MPALSPKPRAAHRLPAHPRTAAAAGDHDGTGGEDTGTTTVGAAGRGRSTPSALRDRAPGADRGDLVGPLERGLAVLRWLAARADTGPAVGPRPVPLAELARGTGLPRASVDRVAATLVACGLVRQDERAVTLAPGLAELGNAYLAACRVPDVLAGAARRLAEVFDESVSLAVPDGDGARFVLQVTRRRALSPVFRVGDLLPAERCSAGVLFAADWSEADWSAWHARVTADPGYSRFPVLWSPVSHPAGTPVSVPGDAAGTAPGHGSAAVTTFADRCAAARVSGHAVDDQLVEAGLLAVAVPVRDTRAGPGERGRVLAAFSVVSHTSRHTAASLAAAVLPELRRVAAEAEAALAADAAVPPPTADDQARAPGESAAKADLGADYLQSLARGLAVLTAFGAATPQATLTELARATGLPRATARRSLLTFAGLGYVHTDGHRYRPLPRVLELGYGAVTSQPLATLAEPHLAALVARVRESASLAVLAGAEIRYLARVPATRLMSVEVTVGGRRPACATALGLVLLAALPAATLQAVLARTPDGAPTPRTVIDPAGLSAVLAEVRDDGHALVTSDAEEGVQSLAVPVRDRRGQVVAAANVAMPAARVSAEQARATMLPALRTAVAGIEADLALVTAYRPLPAG